MAFAKAVIYVIHRIKTWQRNQVKSCFGWVENYQLRKKTELNSDQACYICLKLDKTSGGGIFRMCALVNNFIHAIKMTKSEININLIELQSGSL